MTDVLIMSDNAATLSFQIGEYLASRGSTSDIKAFGRGVSGAASNLLKVVRQKQTRRAPPGSASVKSSVPTSIPTPAAAAHMSRELAERYAKGFPFVPTNKGLVNRTRDMLGLSEESKDVAAMLERFPLKLSEVQKKKAHAFAMLNLEERIKELPALKKRLNLSDKDARHLLLHDILPLTLTVAQEEALNKFAMLYLEERRKALPALEKNLNISDKPATGYLLAIPRTAARSASWAKANAEANAAAAATTQSTGFFSKISEALNPSPQTKQTTGPISVKDAFGKNPLFGNKPLFGTTQKCRINSHRRPHICRLICMIFCPVIHSLCRLYLICIRH